MSVLLIPRIDSDVILYEIGSCGQYKDEEGELVVREFEFVIKLVDELIAAIGEAVMSSGPPVLYITSRPDFIAALNRRNRFMGDEPLVFKPNFREAIAITKPYKGTRKSDKPYHFMNLFLYLYETYDVRIANGIEADDLMSIDQMEDLENSVICTRDKDLRITEGNHYGWACGKQPEFPFQYVDKLGWLKYNEAKKKIEGVGMKFFYSQMITGDTVDNIPGVKGQGPKAAYKLLGEATSVAECKAVVMAMYKEKYPDNARDYFTEQAQLLWMLRVNDSTAGGWNVS